MKIKRIFGAAIGASAIALMMSSTAMAVTLNLHNGGDPRTLDPAKQSGNWEDRPISDCIEGLMTIDAKGEPILGQAKAYEVSEDGLTYTFHLRDDIVWSDGTPVTAQDWVTGLERLENPKTAAEYAYLAGFIAGANDYNTGKSTDPSTIGIKALDDKTVQYTLLSPTPYFLGALTHPSLYPVPTADVQANGEDWASTQHILCNAAFKITEWVPGSYVRSVKNDKYYDAANVKIDEVFYHILEDNAAALNRYRAGEFDLLSDFPTDQYQLLQDQYPGEAHVSPILAVYYYVLNEQKPPLDDVEIRKALSMAIERDVIGRDILGTGDLPAYSWVPPGTASYEGETYKNDWQDLPYEEKVKQAAAIMASKGYTAANPLALQLRYNTNDNHRRIAVAIGAMWEAIGVKIDLFNAETGVHYDALDAGDFQVGRAGWIMDYNDASNMLDLLRTGATQADGTVAWGNNYGRYSNPKFDSLLDQAAKELDLVKRADLMHQAEKIAMDEYGAIPIYDYVSKWVVSPKVSGFEDNAVDRHFVRYMSKAE
jgi:oligopeptide transport system substrate-binding protein